MSTANEQRSREQNKLLKKVAGTQAVVNCRKIFFPITPRMFSTHRQK